MKHEDEEIDLDGLIPGTSYGWRQLYDVLKPSDKAKDKDKDKDKDINARWNSIVDKNKVLLIMRNALLQVKSDIINEEAFGNINLFVNFLQDFSGKDEIEIVKIFSSLDETFQQYADNLIGIYEDPWTNLINPSDPDDEEIKLHAYLGLLYHFLFFYLTKKQKKIFANKYIDSISKSYGYTLQTFPKPTKRGYILPDEGKFAIYQTLIVLYDVFFGHLDE